MDIPCKGLPKELAMSLSFLSRRKSQPKARTRTLHFDSLESRAVLTAIGAAVLPVTEALDDSSVTLQTANGASDLTDNDSGYTPQAPSQSAGAPTITWFNWEMDGATYIFYGSVIDDKPVTEITVHFGGIVSGSTEVCEGGYFALAFFWGTEMGDVTAQAQDADGLWSNIATVWAS
jgi:hypothetical protein